MGESWLRDRERGRPLAANAHEMRGGIEQRHRGPGRARYSADQKSRQAAEGIGQSREESQVAPGIDILFHRQQRDCASSRSSHDLGAIAIPVPAHSGQDAASRACSHTDQITTSAMIRPQDDFPRLQPIECQPHIRHAEPRAILPDHHHLLIPLRNQGRDRALQAFAKTSPYLPVHALR